MKKQFYTVESFLAFKKIERKAFAEMEENAQGIILQEYDRVMKEYHDELESKLTSAIEQLEKSVTEEKHKAVVEEIERIGLELKKNNGRAIGEVDGLRKYLEDNSQVFKQLKEKQITSIAEKEIDITTKGVQGATDITGREVYATLLPGTIRKPVRKTTVLDLFRQKPISGEFVNYREEDTVTRDAKFVIACAKSTHNTKKTWVTRMVQLAKLRDIAEICLDMIEDYDFVESEVRELIYESIDLIAEYELMFGDSVSATSLLSIKSIASEFNHANPLAIFTASFDSANIEQLVDAMKSQINTFGNLNRWVANTVVMNATDVTKYRNLKDKNGNKLVHTLSDAIPTIAGCLVIENAIMPPNTLYVFDSTQGEILMRKNVSLRVSYENNDNAEHEMVSYIAHKRMQFHVPMINRNAFMECSDIAAALTAITKPAV